jgi:hypothetical protein
MKRTLRQVVRYRLRAWMFAGASAASRVPDKYWSSKPRFLALTAVCPRRVSCSMNKENDLSRDICAWREGEQT